MADRLKQLTAALVCLAVAGALEAPSAAAVPPGADAKVLIGKGEFDSGSRWKVRAYRLNRRIDVEISVRNPGVGRFTGGSPLEPQCGEIGWGSWFGDVEESTFGGPVTREVGAVDVTFIEKGGDRIAGEVEFARMSAREAQKIGAETSFDTFVASAPVGVNDFRRVEAIALDEAGASYPGYTWFARNDFHCGTLAS